MQAGPAVWTFVPPRRQALSDQDAAARTGLRGERRVYRLHCSPGARSLEAQDGKKCTPPGILNALCEVMILEHSADLQVLMRDRVVLAHQYERRFVVEVLPLAAHGLVCLGEPTDGLTASVAPLFPLGHPALALRQVALGLTIARWR